MYLSIIFLWVIIIKYILLLLLKVFTTHEVQVQCYILWYLPQRYKHTKYLYYTTNHKKDPLKTFLFSDVIKY